MRFGEIIGQEEEKKHLIHTVEESRISHAQMFLGSEGSGALPMAIAYAQYILCSNRQESDSCGKCASCLKVQAFNHPDVHFSFPIHLTKSHSISDHLAAEWREQMLESPYFGLYQWNQKLGAENKQGVIGNAESLNIVKKLILKSFEGGYKILIMWLPELMNATASNKLLKIIEEPPEKTLFILVAQNQENIISTILSRTQIIKFPRLKEDEIAKYLETQKGISHDDGITVAHLAEGNLAKALSLVEQQDMANFNFDNFVTWMRLCYQRNIAKTIDWVDEIASYGRENQKNFIKFCLHMFRQSIVGHYTHNELVILTKDQDNFLKKFAPFINNKNIVGLSESLNDAYYHIERNANPKILFLDVSLKLFALLKLK